MKRVEEEKDVTGLDEEMVAAYCDFLGTRNLLSGRGCQDLKVDKCPRL